MQHNERRMSGGSVAYETEAPDLSQRKPGGVDRNAGVSASRCSTSPSYMTAIISRYREFWRKPEKFSLHHDAKVITLPCYDERVLPELFL
jgi:hypothetical protein